MTSRPEFLLQQTSKRQPIGNASDNLKLRGEGSCRIPVSTAGLSSANRIRVRAGRFFFRHWHGKINGCLICRPTAFSPGVDIESLAVFSEIHVNSRIKYFHKHQEFTQTSGRRWGIYSASCVV